MNIVYMFKSKVSGKYYIGSKVECEVIEGKIVAKDGRYYYSSCTDESFWEELSEGNLLLEVLEDNIPRVNLLEREAYWQEEKNYKSCMCWNKALATKLNTAMPKDLLHTVQNKFGQTLNEITVQNSTVARKDSAAKREGFSNYGEKMLYYIKHSRNYTSLTSMGENLGRRNYFVRLLKNVKEEDFNKHVDKLKIKTLMREGATFIKACELCNIKDYVARKEFGEDFDSMLDRSSLIAEANGFSNRSDFNLQVLKDFLEGESRSDLSKKYKSVSITTISRILDSEIRERLKINDLG